MEIDDAKRLAKNKAIADRGRETRIRRHAMECKTFELKIRANKLNLRQKEELSMLFVDAKRYYNDIIAFMKSNDVSDYDWKNTIVSVKTKDGSFEKKEIKYLSASERQAVIAQIKSSLKALATSKRHGAKVGKLRFLSEVNQITLRQPSINYAVDFDRKRVRVQGVHGDMRVGGLSQLVGIDSMEMAFAKLVRTPLGYFLKVTVYFPKAKLKSETNGKCIGIDFGCATSFTTSEGDKIDVSVRESDRLKRLSRKANRISKSARSEHKKHLYFLIAREYAKMDNRKKDIACKLAHRFAQYDQCVIQDEMLQAWHKGGHGKAVQHSCMGSIKARLMANPNIVVLDRSCPTTKLCRECGEIHHEMTQRDRVFKCDCGVSEDRDVHAAENMLWFADHKIGVIKIGVERTKFKRGDLEPLLSDAFASQKQVPETNHEASCSSDKR